MRNARFLAALAVANCVLLSPVAAGWFERVNVRAASYAEEIPAPVVQEHGESVLAPSGEGVIVHSEPMPHEVYSPVVPAVPHHHGHAICCKKPKVVYMNHPVLAMLMHKCRTGQAAKVYVQVPGGCCPVDVSVCVPICCVGQVPHLSQSKDLLGRCIYTFCWPCGTKVCIVKRHSGTLVVHSYEL